MDAQIQRVHLASQLILMAMVQYKMPQAGFDPLAQSDTSEADALPPSHHGWIMQKVYLIVN